MSIFCDSQCWLHHVGFSQMIGEKARWELHKNAAYSFEKFLEAAPHKTAAVRPLISHLTNHPSKPRHVGHCWRSKIQNYEEVSLMGSYT